MASGLSHHHLLCMYSSKTHPPFSKTQTLFRNPKSSSVALRTLPKSLSPKNSNTSLQSSPEESKPASALKRADPPGQNPPPRLSSFDSLFVRLRHLRDERFKLDGIFVDILSIALPAALALAADPITSLVDTAFVGHLGSVELAAVGVSASVFNLVSKLFNVPLLNITTSFVAEEQALASKAEDDLQGDRQSKKLLPSVSTSLALAATFGVAEAVALFLGSGVLMNAMGIYARLYHSIQMKLKGVSRFPYLESGFKVSKLADKDGRERLVYGDSPMRIPAESFLAVRAFGAPPIVIALAAQGTFRGFKDTKTPLYAVVAGNLLNAILDAILIFIFDFGIRGAAIATVISEYMIAVILLWKLNSEVLLVPTYIDGRRIIGYLKSGVLLIGRSLAVVVTTTLATSVAAREGPIPMAGHQICIQVWLAVSLLTDALALAGQTLLASGYSQQDYEQARLVIYRVLQIGLVTGIGLGIMLFIGFKAFSSLFSTDPQVLAIAWSGLLFVAGSQPINALAFVIDGLYYGVSDFGFAAYSMVLVGLISSAVILVASPSFGLAGVWTGLFLFMALRVVAGIWRLGTRTGPWKLVWDERKQEG
ncbi:protein DETOXIFICATION 44, chloroplastic-like isoform X1 [Malus sylvestris]|nr:protein DETOXIFICATION 44, chloroplastic-like isoform X1 [Malus domestica]XP_050113422.1 protein DETOXIFICATION 44, chloroplastic-like isoform X1 [Malus sylvestris]